MPLLKLLLLPVLISLGISAATNDQQLRTSNTSAQEVFNYLRCHRQAKNIVVNWGMTSQAGVTRYTVYFSEDNEFFDPIADIPVDNTSLKYTFKHVNVFAGYHYYYIAAIRPGMPAANSITDVVRIVGH